MNNVMNAMDAVAGARAKAFFIINGNRYLFMQLTSFEASMEIKLAEVAILGKTGKGNKPVGWVGTWKATAHYNQSILREMLLEYKRTGKLTPFEIQVENEDASTAVGEQAIILKDCLTKGGILAKFDADSEILDEDIEGTFEDWEMPKTFTPLAGMR